MLKVLLKQQELHLGLLMNLVHVLAHNLYKFASNLIAPHRQELEFGAEDFQHFYDEAS